MTEDVLQYIWQTQSFTKNNLLTTAGEPLSILKQGVLNHDAGPDFLGARLVIDGVEWIGDVEIHDRSSTWNQHQHQHDKAYNSVILHVVWQDDAPITRADGTIIPTLELKPLVSRTWLRKCETLLKSLRTIPCESFIGSVNRFHVVNAYNKALVARLHRKSDAVLQELQALKGDWEQVALKLLFEYFGFKKNNAAFLHLASLTDIRVLQKLPTLQEVEAYLFGLAGMLEGTPQGNDYQQELINTFAWLKKKFAIDSEPMAASWWKFMRLRPANFPTLRIAQLASLLYQRKRIFRSIIEGTAESGSFFRVEQSEFWRSHYHFHKQANTRLKGMGQQGALVLSVNVAAVLLVAYGRSVNDEAYTEKALAFLEAQKPEVNAITRQWQALGVKPENAAESQGAIELFNNYCRQHRCLNCNIGNQVLGAR